MSGDAQNTAAARVAILFWEGYLSVAPSVISAAEEFAGGGYDVDIIYCDRGSCFAPPPVLDAARVRLLPIRQILLPDGRASETSSVGHRMARRVSDYLDRIRFLRHCKRLYAERRYDVLVGVDAMGMLAAGSIARGVTPIIHWSLELPPERRPRDPVHALEIALARPFQRTASVTITQDPVRAEVLRARLGTAPAGPVRLVPNSPVGPPIRKRASFFHRLFGLPPGQRIILYAGGILPHFLSEEAAGAAASWPSDWTLVMHERANRRPTEPFLQRVAAAGGERVRMSLQPVPYEQLDEIFASADICLALYSDRHGENVALIGSSSGKLARALRVGVPVIGTDSPGQNDLITSSGCGVVIRDMNDMAAAISSIFEDYDGYRERAWACYRDHLEFSAAFRPVLSDVRRLIGAAQ